MSKQVDKSRANPQTIQTMFKAHQSAFAAALPSQIKPERMTRIALTELRRTPKLQQCDTGSFLGAVLQCCQLGLEPGAALGEVYLIPFGKVCTVIVGYQGMISLARRSGQIKSIRARNVYKGDKFEVDFGLEEKLVHVPNMENEPSPSNLIASYMVAELTDGGSQVEIMSRAQIDKIMKGTQSGGKSGPWKSHYEEMARKTVIRRGFKYLPKSIEIQKAMEVESEQVQRHSQLLLDEGIPEMDLADTLDAEAVDEGSSGADLNEALDKK